VTSGLTGFLMPRNAVITAITIISDGNNNNNKTKAFEVRVNGVLNTAIALVAGAGNKGTYTNANTNANVAAGDYVQLFSSATGSAAQNVIAVVEIAYRK
jgi:hypothetical protein